VPASVPATPPLEVVTDPKAGRAGTTPDVTVVPVVFTESPIVKDSEKLCALPAVVIAYVPSVMVAGAVNALSPVAPVRPPKVVAVILLPLTAYVDPILVA
jgi:hypothetical protein